MKKIVLMVKKLSTLVIVLCVMLTGCGLITEKSETTHSEVTETKSYPICEFNLESDN